jgi:hypothetical protein
MTIEEQQFLPNDFTVELRYKPNPRMLDHRGNWAALLSNRLDLDKWVIGTNTFDIYDEPLTQRATVAFNRCALTMMDVTEYENFFARAAKLLTTLFELPDFGKRPWIRRLGVKPRFCTPFDGGFDRLMKHVRERYFDLKEGAMDAIGAAVELTDVGANLNMKDDCGEFHTLCGAMKREQSKVFFDYRKQDDLPPVGLYYEIDYFVEAEKEMQDEEIVSTTEKFAREGWLRHQRVRKLIVRS